VTQEYRLTGFPPRRRAATGRSHHARAPQYARGRDLNQEARRRGFPIEGVDP
jgi:hypothetical protein